jgi:hypothetical protein
MGNAEFPYIRSFLVFGHTILSKSFISKKVFMKDKQAIFFSSTVDLLSCVIES